MSNSDTKCIEGVAIDKNRQRGIYRVTLVGSVVNIALSIFKLIGGIVGHSSAMIADAIHSLSDFATDLAVLLFVKLSGKPADRDHAYGHGKFETFGTLTIGIVLAAVGIMMLYDGVTRTISFFQGEPIAVPGMIAFIAAIVSIVAKEWLFRYTIRAERKLHSPAMVANAWHHRSDAFTSIAAAIGIGGAILLGEKWAVLDPIAAAFVSLFIIKAAIDLNRNAIDELLEKSLPQSDIEKITQTLLATPGVKAFHRLRTRRVGNCAAVEMHLKMDGTLTLLAAHEIATDAEHRLRQLLGPDTIITVHMEPENHPQN